MAAGSIALFLLCSIPVASGICTQDAIGEPGRESGKKNPLAWQYFINCHLPQGWYPTSSPFITANWEADSDNRWTIPFGGGLGKLLTIYNILTLLNPLKGVHIFKEL